MKRLFNTLIAWGPFGLLVLSLLDSAGVPVVGGVDALLIAVATSTPGQAYEAALLATLGSVAGSLILFFIARKGGEVLLMKHVSSKRGARMHDWFQRWGLATVFVPALSPIPLPLKIPVFCAGALQVSVFSFAMTVLAARLIRYFILAYLGVHYGAQTLIYAKAHPWQIAGGALAAAVLFVAGTRWVQSRSGQAI